MGNQPRKTAVRDLHRRILRRRGGDCAICHAPIDITLPYLHPMSFEVDHIIPFSKGGPDTLDNKASVHRACNRAKSDSLDYNPVTKQGVTLKRVRAW